MKTKQSPIILLDQDGVLADFFKAAMDIVGGNLDEIEFDKPWTYDIVQWMNFVAQKSQDASDWVTYEKLWQVCNDPNLNWWGGLEPYLWAHVLHSELLRRVQDEHHLVICTYPQPHQECYGQKINWIRHNLPKQNLNAVMMGKQKHLFAKPHHILIDDTDENVNKFRDNGGRAILFPQPWNTNHSRVSNRIGYVLETVDALLQEIDELV